MMFKFTFNNLKISLTAVLLIIIGQVFAFDYYYDGFEKDGYPDPWGNNDNLNPDKWKNIEILVL